METRMNNILGHDCCGCF